MAGYDREPHSRPVDPKGVGHIFRACSTPFERVKSLEEDLSNESSLQRKALLLNSLTRDGLLTPKPHSGVQPRHSQSGFANRNVLQTAHADGIIRIWDAGHGDEIENRAALQVDVARAVGRSADVAIAQMSMSGATGELAVGLQTGEVVVFRWGRNQFFGRDLPHEEAQAFGLEAVKDRAEPGLKEGLLPLLLLAEQHGPVTALKTSEIGFIAAGFERGSIAVIDLRGPAVIYNEGLSGSIANQGKRTSFRKSNSQAPDAAEWPTSIEFGVMSLDGEGKPLDPILGAGKKWSTVPWRMRIEVC